MSPYDIISSLIETGKYKHSDSVTIEVRGDFNFNVSRKSDYIHLTFLKKEVYAVTNMFRVSLVIEGIKFYKDKYIVEIAGWKDAEGKYK